MKAKNEALFYYGLICLIASIAFLFLAKYSNIQVFPVNAWYKPFKFAFSTFAFVWAMAWYCAYLPNFNVSAFNWTVIVLLTFEIAYIAIMAGQGKTSHFNISSSFYAAMYSMMAFAASAVTIYTAYVGILFFTSDLSSLPIHYVWSIRIGIIIFVVFAFEGFLMGSRLSHSVGLVNDNSNLFIIGWSRLVGDLRVSHFIGMHALQVLPLLSFYVFRNTKATMVLGALYALLALATLVQALNSKPLIKARTSGLRGENFQPTALQNHNKP